MHGAIEKIIKILLNAPYVCGCVTILLSRKVRPSVPVGQAKEGINHAKHRCLLISTLRSL